MCKLMSTIGHLLDASKKGTEAHVCLLHAQAEGQGGQEAWSRRHRFFDSGGD